MQDQGSYQAVVMEAAQDEEEEKKSGKGQNLSQIQQLYKWARSGDSTKLKAFIREQQQTHELDVKDFLSWADDGTHEVEEEIQETGEKKACACLGGGDDEEFAIPKFKPYKTGNTALHFAALHANAQFCQDLFELGAKFTDSKNSLNSSPLHLAASSGDPETLKYILEKYVSGNSRANALKEKNKIGNTPIHCAVYANSIECLKLLFEHCKQVDIVPTEALMERNHTGTQALRYASSAEMKNFINGIFNPDMADEDEKDNGNDNDNLAENNDNIDDNATPNQATAENEEGAPEYNEEDTGAPVEEEEE